MNSKKWSKLFAVICTIAIVGCGGDGKSGPAEIPKDLNKDLPKVAAPAGGGGGGAAKKAANPNAKAD